MIPSADKRVWVRKDGKRRIDNFLSSSEEIERLEVINQGILHGSSVFNPEATPTNADNLWIPAYRDSLWFGPCYAYLASGVTLEGLSAKARKSFFNKILDYRFDENGFLWKYSDTKIGNMF